MSWIHIADLLRIIETAIDEPALRGAVNAVAPAPERQGEFQRALARACAGRSSCAFPRSRCASLGEMAQLLVQGQRVAPRRLLTTASSSATSRWRARCAT